MLLVGLSGGFMKFVVIALLTVVASLSHAKTKVDFNRVTASSQTDGLSQAFKNAVQGSDADLNQTKTSVLVEDTERQARWNSREKKQIVIQGTAAVDSMAVHTTLKKFDKDSQVDTQEQIKDELTELN